MDGDKAVEIVIEDQLWDWDGTAMRNIQHLNEGGASVNDVSLG
jgi:hypothetical protein